MKKDVKKIAILLFIGIAGIVFCVSRKKSDVAYIGSGMSIANEETAPDSSLSGISVAESPAVSSAGVTVAESVTSPSSIFVYVCGCVKNEGVYELAEGDRAIKAVELAGGFKKNADTKLVNLAAQVSDGMEIYVPEEGESAAAGNTGTGNGANLTAVNGVTNGNGTVNADSGNTLVNINTASSEELQTIPGVGPSKASLIIDFRNSNGGFKKIEDIMQIKGIKEGLFNKIKDKITV